MYARMLTIDGIDYSRRDEMEAMVRKQALTFLREQPGWKGYVAMGREDGKGHAVILWETKEDADAAEEASRERRAATAEQGGFRFTSIELYEVLIFELA